VNGGGIRGGEVVGAGVVNLRALWVAHTAGEDARMQPQIGPWDVGLLLVVTGQSTVMAYVHSPRVKALVYTLPLPFTLASLALAKPVDATHVLGICCVPLYANCVRWLHYNARLPIAVAIAGGALANAIVAVSLADVIPRTPGAFWLSMAVLLAGGLVLLLRMPSVDEPGHRSLLPVPAKVLIIGAVVTALVLAKQHLGGFMTGFPMVGVVGAYEARRSLRTLCGAVPILLLSFVPLLGVAYLLGPRMGLPASLALGWLGYLLVTWLLARRQGIYSGTNGERRTTEGDDQTDEPQAEAGAAASDCSLPSPAGISTEACGP